MRKITAALALLALATPARADVWTQVRCFVQAGVCVVGTVGQK